MDAARFPFVEGGMGVISGLVELCSWSLGSTPADLEMSRSPMNTKQVQSSLFWIFSG